MCECVFKVDTALEKRQQEIKRVILFGSGEARLSNPVISTEWRGDRKPRGKKLVNLFANYCPFCGEEYKEQQ